MNLEELKTKVKEATLTESSPLSEHAKEIKECITAKDFGCSKESVSRLVSLIIGEDLTIGNLSKFVAVVPLKEYDSHNYLIGNPCILHDNIGHAVRSSMFCGNRLPIATNGIVRKATELEIDMLFTNFEMLLTDGADLRDLEMLDVDRWKDEEEKSEETASE